MPHHARSLFVLGFLLAAATAQCPARGLTLATAGGRLGDQWSIGLSGTPAAFGLIGFDLAPGPTNTPLGQVCLGLTPFLATTAFTLDLQGLATRTGILPVNPGLVGTVFHVAAIAVDAGQPGGFALSNGAALSPRQPRQFWFDRGSSSPFGTTPGTVAALDLVTESIAFTRSLPSSVRLAATVRERNWLLILLDNNRLLALDGTTGNQTFTATFTGLVGLLTQMVPVPGGNDVVLLNSGTPPGPFSPGTPGGISVISLITGTATRVVPLSSGQPSALLLVPGTTVALLRLRDRVAAIDFATGAHLPSLTLPTLHGDCVDWQLAGSLLYLLQAGNVTTGGAPAITMAVPSPLVWLLTQPVAMAPLATSLRAGPGTMGASLLVFSPTAADVHEFRQGSLAPTAVIPTGTGTAAIELSSLGTEWLLLCNGAGCGGTSLRLLPAGSTSLVGPFPVAAPVEPWILVSPSAVFGKATVAAGLQPQPMRTDPFALSGAVTWTLVANRILVVGD